MDVLGNKEADYIGRLLSGVKKPGRYIGNEVNISRKDWGAADLRIALVFPDLYEIGMSHHGLQILQLPGPVAMAFLPQTPYARELADKAHAQGKEVLLHLPMPNRQVSHGLSRGLTTAPWSLLKKASAFFVRCRQPSGSSSIRSTARRSI